MIVQRKGPNLSGNQEVYLKMPLAIWMLNCCANVKFERFVRLKRDALRSKVRSIAYAIPFACAVVEGYFPRLGCRIV